MKVLPPGNPQIRANVPARPELTQTARPAEPPAGRQAQRADDGSPRPGAVANAHRIERPMPAEPARPAPRGSFVNLLV